MNHKGDGAETNMLYKHSPLEAIVSRCAVFPGLQEQEILVIWTQHWYGESKSRFYDCTFRRKLRSSCAQHQDARLARRPSQTQPSSYFTVMMLLFCVVCPAAKTAAHSRRRAGCNHLLCTLIFHRKTTSQRARPAAAAKNGNNRMMERNRLRLQSLHPVQADAETNVRATRWWRRERSGVVRKRESAGGGGWGGGGLGWGSDAQGHVAEQPLLRAAVVAVSEGGNHLVLLRRHVQTLVAVHVQQGEPLESRRRE